MVVEMNKKGQITIFVIIGIILAIGIVMVYLLAPKGTTEPSASENPKAFIDKCVKSAVQASVEKVLANGGRANPELFLRYRNETYNYLCYQGNYYTTCINHYPQLKEIVEQEIKNDSNSKVKKCFADLKKDLESKGYDVSERGVDWDVVLLPKRISIKASDDISFTKGQTSQSLKDFSQTMTSPFYELISVAREIVNQESQYCNFEYNGFMLLYPEFDIKRIDYNDNKVYRVTDRLSGKTFKFAVRSCVFPPGL